MNRSAPAIQPGYLFRVGLVNDEAIAEAAKLYNKDPYYVLMLAAGAIKSFDEVPRGSKAALNVGVSKILGRKPQWWTE